MPTDYRIYDMRYNCDMFYLKVFMKNAYGKTTWKMVLELKCE